MKNVIINQNEYYDKVYGGWLGKNIGGTLGVPVEGRKELLNLEFYPELSDRPLPNDDLELQLVWLHALEQYGARLTAKELGQEWVEHVFYCSDEYGYALTNLRRGLIPPVSGWFNNPFTNCMGSPIRSEIWAMVSPGAPGVAAYYAYQDAIVDHAGGEGVYGEMFFAAIESAAFLESDINKLLDIGLFFIPEECRTAKAIRDLRKWHEGGITWVEARELILKHHGHSNFTDAPQNIAFTILGWLYGQDFGDAILKAVNCGYDTDCTGATLGAILGIIGGAKTLPGKWVKPIGENIAVSPGVVGFPAPVNLDELTGRTLKVCMEVLRVWDIPVHLSQDQGTCIPQEAIDDKGEIYGDYDPRWLWDCSFHTERRLIPGGSTKAAAIEVVIDYGAGGPAIGRNQSKEVSFTFTNTSLKAWEGAMEILIPVHWKKPDKQPFELAPGHKFHWNVTLESDDRVEPYYNLALSIHRNHDDNLWNTVSIGFALVAATHWTVWEPESAEGQHIICAGNRIEFEKAVDTSKEGVYCARSTLVNPRDRKVRLIAATSSGVKMSIDGNTVVQDSCKTEFMPAYHRAPKTKLAEMELPAGSHELELELKKGDEPLEIYVLPVATRDTKEPDPFYYFTDIVFV